MDKKERKKELSYDEVKSMLDDVVEMGDIETHTRDTLLRFTFNCKIRDSYEKI